MKQPQNRSLHVTNEWRHLPFSAAIPVFAAQYAHLAAQNPAALTRSLRFAAPEGILRLS